MAVTSAKAARSVFACSECGHESPEWLGRCPGCDSWISNVEHAPAPRSAVRAPSSPASAPIELGSMPDDDQARLPSGLPEFDRVLGGGIVSDSLVLVGGDPGIGKSTLLLQVARRIANGQAGQADKRAASFHKIAIDKTRTFV